MTAPPRSQQERDSVLVPEQTSQAKGQQADPVGSQTHPVHRPGLTEHRWMGVRSRRNLSMQGGSKNNGNPTKVSAGAGSDVSQEQAPQQGGQQVRHEAISQTESVRWASLGLSVARPGQE